VDATQAALARLKRVLLGLAAELPGTLVVQHVDRALYIIRAQQSIASQEFMAASVSLLAASEAAVNGRPAALVPDVLKDIESAKAAVDKGNAEEAVKTLQTVIEKATTHPAAGVVNKALASVRGGEEALFRQAWPVVVAELTELDNRLAELSKSVAPPTTPTTTGAETKKGATAAPPAGEAATPAPATPAPASSAQEQPTPATPPSGAREATPQTVAPPPAAEAPPAAPPASSGRQRR
jgi:cell wall-associated NlpC family hydrolase